MYCPANAGQPAAPLTPNRRPPPLCLPLLFGKPKGGLSREINLFRSLSARLPSRWLFPGCSDNCRPGQVFRGRLRSRPPVKQITVPHTAAELPTSDVGCLCFKTDPLPLQPPAHPEEARNNLLTHGQAKPSAPTRAFEASPGAAAARRRGSPGRGEQTFELGESRGRRGVPG